MARGAVTPNTRNRLPREPGVYYYQDTNDQTLYVGKATSLRDRVGSYWVRPLDARLTEMLPKITKIQYQTTDTALEALILEANEIQRLNPPVNIRGKDSKTFAQIALTKEDFPRFIIIRPTQKLDVTINRTFGPYVSAQSARQALKTLSSIFKFNCKGKPYSGRPCFNYHLGSCPGVCVGKITPEDYKKQIRKVVQFLEGKKARIITTTRRQMEEAAKSERFELAAKLRNELFALTHIRDTAFMTEDSTEFLSIAFPPRLEAYDISNIGSAAAVASMIVLEYGRPNPSEYKKFRIRSTPGQNDVAMIREVFTRRLQHPEWGMPDLVLVDGGLAQVNAARVSAKRAGQPNLQIIGVVKGPQRKLARLVLTDTARQWLNDHRLTTQLFEPVARLARDEAHRFAISYHRKVRNKSLH